MQFPLTLTFKLFRLHKQMSVTDPAGALVCYVKQRAFKLKEDVTIFEDEAQARPVYHMRADRVLDISARYTITSADGSVIGSIKREGMKSFWQARYRLLNAQGSDLGIIREENPWLWVIEALLGFIPIVGEIIGIFINPSYLVEIPEGEAAFYLKKRRSFFERRFMLEQRRMLAPGSESLALAGVMMMVLLERGRG